MTLTAGRVETILRVRAKVNAGRTETLVEVASENNIRGVRATAGCLFYEAVNVPAGITNRIGDISRRPWDAVAVMPHAWVPPADLRAIVRTDQTGDVALDTAAMAGKMYTILAQTRVGLGTRGHGGGSNTGNRWVLLLRNRRR